ncbi:MAG TPA: hypothetical protein IAB69_01295 [Candidatus Coproplasma excrementigallinarum]|uniref:Uncharacterized protein n=1 Tax=Candidatus Coproplasma excrementigallinarum TaxID=2840747 RepID=A0A9D1MJI7_9FIRM|nr:hypothetical protein [Candidatus Coproplasma excrementigallinarum]
MESSLLDRLCMWAGEEGSLFKMSKAESDLLGNIDDMYTYFCGKLDGEDREKFKKLCECFDEVSNEETEAFFRIGFKLAFRLAAECYT